MITFLALPPEKQFPSVSFRQHFKSLCSSLWYQHGCLPHRGHGLLLYGPKSADVRNYRAVCCLGPPGSLNCRLVPVFLTLVCSPFLSASLLLYVCCESDHPMSSVCMVAIAFGILLLKTKDEKKSYSIETILDKSSHHGKEGLACSSVKSLSSVTNAFCPPGRRALVGTLQLFFTLRRLNEFLSVNSLSSAMCSRKTDGLHFFLAPGQG